MGALLLVWFMQSTVVAVLDWIPEFLVGQVQKH